MNPFELKPMDINKSIKNWCELYPKSYNICEISPYTKTRIVLMNGTEFEAVKFSHQFSYLFHVVNQYMRLIKL